MLTEAQENKLIIQHLSLPKAIAKERITGRGGSDEYDELVATGNLALVEAGRSFDPSRGPFFDWARRHIMSAITKFQTRQGWFPDDEIGEPPELIEGSKKERVYEWQTWESGLYEIWGAEDTISPEEIRISFDEIKDRSAQLDAALISLTRLQKRIIASVYIRGRTLADFAREERISYFQVWGEAKKAVRKMRSVIDRIEQNQKKPATRVAKRRRPMVRKDTVVKTTKRPQ